MDGCAMHTPSYTYRAPIRNPETKIRKPVITSARHSDSETRIGGPVNTKQGIEKSAVRREA